MKTHIKRADLILKGNAIILFVVLVLLTTLTLASVAKPAHKRSAGHIKPVTNRSLSGSPTLSYAAETYTAGTAIAALTPTSSGVAAQGYGSPVAIGSGFSSPGSVAVDASGNVYVADKGNNEIKKIAAGSGTVTVIGSGFSGPTGVAVDASGNVYVADYGNNAVKEIQFIGGTIVSLVTGYAGVNSVAVDAAGNVYVTNSTTNQVVRLTQNGNLVRPVGTGYSSPTGVAVDAAGNVYVADEGNHLVKEVPINTGVAVSIGSGFTTPYGVSVDAAGNLYVADLGKDAVMQIPASGGAPISISSGYNEPSGLTTDASGNVYEADQGSSTVKKITPTGGYYLASPLPQGLIFNSSTGVITGTPLLASAATNYMVTAYNASGSVAAEASIKVNAPAVPTISYASPQSYTAGSAITALSPTKTGVAALGYSVSQVKLGLGLISPIAVTADAAGNIYVTDAGDNEVKKIAAGGGATSVIAAGFSNPYGIAIDANGNLYISDTGNEAIKKISAGSTTPVTIASGTYEPYGIAVDAVGDVYFGDASDGTIKMIPFNNSAPIIVASGFSNVTGIALDAFGNIYAADDSGNSITEIPVNGGSHITLLTGKTFTGLTADGAGNLYFDNFNDYTIQELLAGTTTPITLGSAGYGPIGLFVNTAGVIDVADVWENTIRQITPSGGYFLNTPLPQGLILNSSTGAISGTPAVVSPAASYTVTAYDLGGGKTAAVSIQTVAPALPAISYSSPQSFVANTPNISIAPTGSGVAAQGYAGNNTITIAYPLTAPYGIAADQSGNVFISDYAENVVYKVPAGGGATTTVGTGFLAPEGIAVDAAGDIFVADYGNSAVKEIPVGGGATVTLGSGFKQPTSVAVDAAGDVFIADFGNNAVKEIVAGTTTPVTIGSGFSLPLSVAVDSNGIVYVADSGNNAIKGIYGGTSIATIATGPKLVSVAVDAQNNIYVANYNAETIEMYTEGDGTPTVIGHGFTNLTNIAVSSGRVSVAGYGNESVLQLVPSGGYYLNAALPAGLTFNNYDGSISGTPTKVTAAANYVITGYNAGGGKPATLNLQITVPPPPVLSYTSPPSFYVDLPATPVAPAVSSGVATFGYNATGTVVGVYGAAANASRGLAIDAAGNTYVAAVGSTSIIKTLASNLTTVNIGSGFSNPWGVAVDAAGNVYVADSGNNAVKEVPINGGAIITLGSGFNNPIGIALDAQGNIYVTDSGNGAIKMMPPGGGTPVTLATGLSSSACGLALDAPGNIYVAELSNNLVLKIPAGGGTPTSIGSGFGGPIGVAVDAGGNIIISNVTNNNITMIAAGTNAVSTLISVNGPCGIALDAAGDIDELSVLSGEVTKYAPSGGYHLSSFLPAGLNFDDNTGIISGTPTTLTNAANYTVTAYNPTGGTPAAISISTIFPPLPTISYTTPQNYIAGTAITALTPTSSRVSAFQYSAYPTILGSGFTGPYGIALDASGNVFVADPTKTFITELPANGGASINIGSGISGIIGVAVDLNDNLYVGTSSGEVIEVTPAGTQTTLSSSFTYPVGLAVDAAGNVYVCDATAQKVMEIPGGNGTPIVLASGLSDPYGIAVDAAGNIYFTDLGTDRVYRMPKGGGTPISIGTSFNVPAGVAVDAAGNVYVPENANNDLKMIRAIDGVTIVLTSGFKVLYGIAIDNTGNVYIAESGGVKKVLPLGGYFLGSALPAGLKFDNTTGTISGTPTTAGLQANYTVRARNPSGFTAAEVNIQVRSVAPATISYTTPHTYNTGTAIAALMPTTSGVSAFAYSATPATVGAGFITPQGIALDAAGNIYVTDLANNSLKEIPAGGGPTVILSTAFGQPTDVAVDAAGNIYVTDAKATTITELPAGGGTLISLGSGFNYPTGIAADAAGNIYVADYSNGAVKKIPAGGGATATIGSGFSRPYTVAVDAAGNVYVGDDGNQTVKMIAAGTGVITTIGTTFPSPAGLSVDAAGNVYVVDNAAGTLSVIQKTGGATVTLASGFSGSNGLALDGAGNAYFTDYINHEVVQEVPVGGYFLNKALPVGLGFNITTGVISGTPTVASAATNYTVTAYNSGGGTPAVINIGVGSSGATLSNLTVSNGTLSPAFATGTTSYTDVVHSVSSIAFRATTTDPTATETINGTAVPEGTVSFYVPLNAGVNTITIVVTAKDGVTKDTYSIAVTRLPEVATLSKLTVSSGTLTPAFATATTSYTDVAHSVSSIAFRATTTDPLATETINGTAVPEGTVSPYIPLNAGVNNISVVITAQDGVTKDTYTVAVTRLPEVATLSKLTISSGTLSPAFAAGTTSYTDVAHSVSSIAFRATTTDALATETINGTIVPEGTVSYYVPLNVGVNNIKIVVTAQDGVTMDTYTVAVTRLPEIATLSGLTISSGTLTPAFASTKTSYTDNVANTVSSIAFRATTTDALATETIDGTAVPEGTVSPYFPLNVGANTITIIVTAQDGITTDTYTIAVTRAAPPGANLVYQPISVEIATETPQLANDGIMVHQGVSPNGDGIDDFLQIDNITNYPDNRLAIMNRNGMLVYEAKGYDNASRVFDGHSNKNGTMQLPGTYFYELDYTVNGITKHKTGFLVLKY
jgi:gliding motility-associated-like protein